MSFELKMYYITTGERAGVHNRWRVRIKLKNGTSELYHIVVEKFDMHVVKGFIFVHQVVYIALSLNVSFG